MKSFYQLHVVLIDRFFFVSGMYTVLLETIQINNIISVFRKYIYLNIKLTCFNN